jgi:hypothetical protein
MKVSDFFNARYRESERLVQELEAHQALWPDIMARYAMIDGECIELAAKLAAARLAQSPSQISLEADLQRKRWARDAEKHRHSNKRDELHRQIESYTGKPIRKFAEECLQRAKDLSKKYTFEILEPAHDLDGRRRRGSVKISHNWDRLTAAKERIFSGMREISEMRHSTLSALETRIKNLRAEFENFDYATLQVEEVTEIQAKDMAPPKEDSSIPQKGTLMPDGKVWVHPQPDSPRVSQLADRITQLEKNS